VSPRSTFLVAALGLVACNSDEGVIQDSFVPSDTLGGEVVETFAPEVSPEVASEVEAETDVAPPREGRLVINEIACQADPEEWVELVNVGDADVELRGYRLADSPNKRGVHLAPGTLRPREHVVVRGAHIDDLGPRQYENGPSLAADLREPDLAASHSSVQASTSDQNGSGCSG
jgi:hypothetical protein